MAEENTSQEEAQPIEPKAEEPVKDSHGQPGINKERHDREVADLKATIKELQGKLDEASKSEAGREEMGKKLQESDAKIAELEQRIIDSETDHRLEMERCRNLKAARALLGDYNGDVSKLKESEPWLFEENQPQGATGIKPSAPPTASILDELREAAGLSKKG